MSPVYPGGECSFVVGESSKLCTQWVTRVPAVDVHALVSTSTICCLFSSFCASVVGRADRNPTRSPLLPQTKRSHAAQQIEHKSNISHNVSNPLAYLIFHNMSNRLAYLISHNMSNPLAYLENYSNFSHLWLGRDWRRQGTRVYSSCWPARKCCQRR